MYRKCVILFAFFLLAQDRFAKASKKKCNDYCYGPYEPVCAVRLNAYKTFSNRCGVDVINACVEFPPYVIVANCSCNFETLEVQFE